MKKNYLMWNFTTWQSLPNQTARKSVCHLFSVPQSTGEQILPPVVKGRPRLFKGAQPTVQNLIMSYLTLCHEVATLLFAVAVGCNGMKSHIAGSVMTVCRKKIHINKHLK
jgi:hypothetical protein